MNLSLMKPGTRAVVETVQPLHAADTIALRLVELGFVRGEAVRVLAHGPFGASTIAVQLGSTRFALRHTEAARIRVRLPSPIAGPVRH